MPDLLPQAPRTLEDLRRSGPRSRVRTILLATVRDLQARALMASLLQYRSFHRFLQHRSFAFGALGNHDQARVGDEEALTIALEVIADLLALRHENVLVDDRAPNFRMTPDIRIVHDHRVFNQTVGVHAHGTSQHRIADRAARHDASFADHRMQCETTPAVLVEDEFRGRLIVIRGPQ